MRITVSNLSALSDNNIDLDTSEDNSVKYGMSMIEDVGYHGEARDLESSGFGSIGLEESNGEHSDEGGSNGFVGWFTMNRKNGGPTYYSSLLFPFPEFLYSKYIVIWTLVFSIPLISFVVLMPSFRKKHLSSVLVVVLCIMSGWGIICAYVSSSWLIGETEVNHPMVAHGTPVKSRVCLWVGLWHANLTYITPNKYINHMVTWNDRKEIKSFHKTALNEGWPMALVSLTAELSGEGIAWKGVLGDGIFYAGSMTSYPLVATIYAWGVWVITFFMAPELVCQPIIATGILLATSVLTYISMGLFYFPAKILVSGSLMELRLGWAWWLTGGFSIGLTIIGSILLVYDYLYPGKLSAMFKLDFYSQTECLAKASEVLFAYEKPPETYSQIYPLSMSYSWYGNVDAQNQRLINESKDQATADHSPPKSEHVSSGQNSFIDKDSSGSTNATLEYVDETTSHNTPENKMSSVVPPTASNSSEGVLRRAASEMTLRKRTPPEKNTKTISDPALADTMQYATIRKGRSLPRQVSVPTVIPQVSPRLSAGGSHKKSFSRIHSKYRPAYSPRKPSMVSLLSIPRLEMDETNENITHL